MKSERTYLFVSYREKDEAKAAGARWDPERRRWYLPEGMRPPEECDKWIPRNAAMALGAEAVFAGDDKPVARGLIAAKAMEIAARIRGKLPKGTMNYCLVYSDKRGRALIREDRGLVALVDMFMVAKGNMCKKCSEGDGGEKCRRNCFEAVPVCTSGTRRMYIDDIREHYGAEEIWVIPVGKFISDFECVEFLQKLELLSVPKPRRGKAS